MWKALLIVSFAYHHRLELPVEEPLQCKTSMLSNPCSLPTPCTAKISNANIGQRQLNVCHVVDFLGHPLLHAITADLSFPHWPDQHSKCLVCQPADGITPLSLPSVSPLSDCSVATIHAHQTIVEQFTSSTCAWSRHVSLHPCPPTNHGHPCPPVSPKSRTTPAKPATQISVFHCSTITLGAAQ